MDDYMNGYDQTQPSVMESASGTTSPANSQSGPGAYIVTLICIILMFGLCVAVTSCAKEAFSFAINAADRGFSDLGERYYHTDDDEDVDVPLFDEDFNGDSFEDYFNEIFGDTYGTIENRNRRDRDSDTQNVDYTPLELLHLDLSIYGGTVDEYVSANAYAGADADVKDFVRELVLTDREATDSIILQFRAAARDEESFNEHIEEAREIAVDAYNATSSQEIPTCSAEVQEYLEEAQTCVGLRWTAVFDLLDMLEGGKSVSYKDISKLDETMYDATVNAAEALEDALKASSK